MGHKPRTPAHVPCAAHRAWACGHGVMASRSLAPCPCALTRRTNSSTIPSSHARSQVSSQMRADAKASLDVSQQVRTGPARRPASSLVRRWSSVRCSVCKVQRRPRNIRPRARRRRRLEHATQELCRRPDPPSAIAHHLLPVAARQLAGDPCSKQVMCRRSNRKRGVEQEATMEERTKRGGGCNAS
jgi:hypothetical protein